MDVACAVSEGIQDDPHIPDLQLKLVLSRLVNLEAHIHPGNKVIDQIVYEQLRGWRRGKLIGTGHGCHGMSGGGRVQTQDPCPGMQVHRKEPDRANVRADIAEFFDQGFGAV